jgi:hypothetical protein
MLAVVSLVAFFSSIFKKVNKMDGKNKESETSTVACSKKAQVFSIT